MGVSSKCADLASKVSNIDWDAVESMAQYIAGTSTVDNAAYVESIQSLLHDLKSDISKLENSNNDPLTNVKRKGAAEDTSTSAPPKTGSDGEGDNSSSQSGNGEDSGKVQDQYVMLPAFYPSVDPYGEDMTKLNEHIMQKVGVLLTKVGNIFKLITKKSNPEFGKLIKERLNIDGLDEFQQAAVKSFKLLAKDVEEVINKQYYKQNFFPNNLVNKFGTEPKNEHFGGDLFQQLLTTVGEGTDAKKEAPDAVLAALTYGVYQAILSMGNNQFPTKDAVAHAHDVPVEELSASEYTRLKHATLRPITAYNQWGRHVVKALGLSLNKAGSPNMLANLQSSFGAQVYQILRALDYIRVETVTPPKNTAEGRELGKTFFVIEETMPAIPDITDKSKGSGSLIQKLFEGKETVNAFYTKPVTDVDEKTATGMSVPAYLQNILRKFQAVPWTLKKDVFNGLDSLGSIDSDGISLADRLVGVLSPNDILALQFQQRAGAESANRQLQAELDAVYEGINNNETAMFDTGFYLKTNVWKMLRVGVTGLMNPTNSKIHRAMMTTASWVSTVHIDNVEEVNNFLMRVAEGFDIPVDRTSNTTSAAKLQAFVSTPALVSAIGFMQDHLKNKTSFTSESGESIVNAVESTGLEGGGRMQAYTTLVAYAKYLNALEASKQDYATSAGVVTSFETDIIGQVDGVSNGPILTLLMQGVSAGVLTLEELFTKGGFFTDGVNKDYNVWREQVGNEDLYETIASGVNGDVVLYIDWLTGEVAKNPKNTEAVRSLQFANALWYFTGKTDKNGVKVYVDRSRTKGGTNPIVFGSSSTKAVRAMFYEFLDDVLTKIAKVHKDPDAESVAELQSSLRALGFREESRLTIEELHNNFGFNKQDITNLWFAYNGTAKNPKIGKAIGESFEAFFDAFRQNNTQIIDATTNAFATYDSVKQYLIDEQLQASGIEYKADTITVGIPKSVLDSIDQRLKDMGITPIMPTFLGMEEGNSEAGLLLAKSFIGSSQQESYKATATGALPFGIGLNKATTTHGEERLQVSPGVLSTSIGTHSGDAYVAMETLNKMLSKLGMPTFNMHDAAGTGLKGVTEMAKTLNQAVFALVSGYTPMAAAAAASIRTFTKTMAFLDKERGAIGAVIDSVTARTGTKEEQYKELAKYAVADATKLLSLAWVAKDANDKKNAFLLKVQHVNQYALEGGSYEVTEADRDNIRERELEFNANYAAQVEALNKVIAKYAGLAGVTNLVISEPLVAKADEVLVDIEKAIKTLDTSGNGVAGIAITKLLLTIESHSKNKAYTLLAAIVANTRATIHVIDKASDISILDHRTELSKINTTKNMYVLGEHIYLFNGYIPTTEKLLEATIEVLVTKPDNFSKLNLENLNELFSSFDSTWDSKTADKAAFTKILVNILTNTEYQLKLSYRDNNTEFMPSDWYFAHVPFIITTLATAGITDITYKDETYLDKDGTESSNPLLILLTVATETLGNFTVNASIAEWEDSIEFTPSDLDEIDADSLPLDNSNRKVLTLLRNEDGDTRDVYIRDDYTGVPLYALKQEWNTLNFFVTQLENTEFPEYVYTPENKATLPDVKVALAAISKELTKRIEKDIEPYKQHYKETFAAIYERFKIDSIKSLSKLEVPALLIIAAKIEAITQNTNYAQPGLFDDTSTPVVGGVNTTTKEQQELAAKYKKGVSLDDLLETVISDVKESTSYKLLAKMLKGGDTKVYVLSSVAEVVNKAHKDAIASFVGNDPLPQGIYVDGTVYLFKVDGKLPSTETLLHEAVHTVITTFLLDIKSGKIKDAESIETYRRIERLYTSVVASKSMFLSKQDAEVFDFATENIDEFVTYGLTSPVFQKMLSEMPISPHRDDVKSYFTSNKFLAFVESVASVFGLVLNITKKGHFNKAKTKSLNNALLGVLTQGASLIDQAKQQSKNSSTNTTNVRAMRAANGLYTHSTLEVFTALQDNQNPLRADVQDNLTKLLSTIVNKLHGPFGTLHATHMKDTPLDEASMYKDAKTKGALPIAMSLQNAGLVLSDQESFVADQVAITIEAALDQPSMYKYRRVLEKLYVQTAAATQPKDFYLSDWSQATPLEVAQTTALYNYIFKSSNTGGQALVRFAALGLVSTQVINALNNVKTELPDVKLKTTLFSKLHGVFSAVVNFWVSKVTGVNDDIGVADNIKTMIHNLVAAEVGRQEQAAQFGKQSIFSKGITAITSIQDMRSWGKDTIQKIARSSAVRNSVVRAIPVVGPAAAKGIAVLGLAIDAVADRRIEVIVEQGMSIRNRAFNGPLGFTASFVSEVLGETDIKARFVRLLQLTQGIAGKREEFIERTAAITKAAFINGANHTKEQKASITQLLRTGLGTTTYTAAQVQEFVNDPAKLAKELDTVIASLKPISKGFTKFLRYKSEALGIYVMSGVSYDLTGLALNATNIVRMVGAPSAGKLKAQEATLIPIINNLVSLYALQNMSNSSKTSLKSVLKEEIPRGTDNGIKFVMALHNKVALEAQDSLFGNDASLMQHGDIPDVVNPNVHVVYVQKNIHQTMDQQVVTYTRAGYVNYGVIPATAVSHGATTMMVHKNLPETRRLTGLFSVLSDKTKGKLIHDGDLNGFFGSHNKTMNSIVNRGNVASFRSLSSSGFVLDTTGKPNNLVPVVDTNGDITNYSQVDSNVLKDTALQRNNDYSYLLGKYIGSTYEKQTSKEHNSTVIKAVHELYTANYVGNERDYLLVGPKSKLPEYQDAFFLLPEETRNEIEAVWGSKNMFIRKDMLDMVFGYRKLTAGDAMLRSPATQGHIIKGLTSLFEHVYAQGGSPDDLRVARLRGSIFMKQFQRGVEEVVSETKNTIVVRMVKTVLGNEMSNISMLYLNGMGLVEALQEKGRALSALNVYRAQSEELYKLELDLVTGNRSSEHPQFIERIGLLQESINKNPVKVLIDAGFSPTIAEDVETISEDYSYKGALFSAVANRLTSSNKGTSVIKEFGKQLYMAEDTGVYQFLRYATQVSDFTARYALYQHLLKNPKLTKEERFSKISQAFVNYDMPSHRLMEAANNVGLLMFTKYAARIQRPLWDAMRDNPNRAFGLWMFGQFLPGVDLITDSSVTHKLYIPFKSSVFEAPYVIDDISTIHAIMSTAGSLIPGK